MPINVRCPDHCLIIASRAVAIVIAATTFATDLAQAQAFRGCAPGARPISMGQATLAPSIHGSNAGPRPRGFQINAYSIPSMFRHHP